MRSRTESGFSLIEVMITSFILAVGLLGIVALQGIAKKSLANTDKQIEAAFLTRTALQELRADTSWISSVSGANDAILPILSNVKGIAKTSQLAICYYYNSAEKTILISTSWQKQHRGSAKAKPDAKPPLNDVSCGTPKTDRHQVLTSSLIMEAT